MLPKAASTATMITVAGMLLIFIADTAAAESSLCVLVIDLLWKLYQRCRPLPLHAALD
jgi:hypothetical protein